MIKIYRQTTQVTPSIIKVHRETTKVPPSIPNLVLERGLLLDGGGVALLGSGGPDKGKVGDDLLGVLGLAGTGLAGDEDGLVLVLCKFDTRPVEEM